jgi:hypothetical protein
MVRITCGSSSIAKIIGLLIPSGIKNSKFKIKDEASEKCSMQF